MTRQEAAAITYPAMYRPLWDQPAGLGAGFVACICTAPTFDHEDCPHCHGDPRVVMRPKKAGPSHD